MKDFFADGRRFLAEGRLFESLENYAGGIRRRLPQGSAELEAELAVVRGIDHTGWVRDLLLIALRIATGQAQPELQARRKTFRAPVVILAGGTGAEASAAIGAVREKLTRAFEGFSGTIISGGTTSGVAGLAGEIARSRSIEAIGYLPSPLPQGAEADSRYTTHVAVTDEDFSPREPLQYWVDLLAAGFLAGDVKLVGVNGGRIAASEYQMALAFGAEVAIIQPAERAAADLCANPDWRSDERLLPLPNDARTMWAFVNPRDSRLDAAEVEEIARRIHEKFRAANNHDAGDPAMKPWEELSEDRRDANRAQAAWAPELLEAAGYCVERGADGAVPELSPAEVESLAEMEHGRWVVERTRKGWRPGERDAERKTSPYLIAWEELAEPVREYDREAVRSWPGLLAEAGFTVRTRLRA